MKSDKCPDCQVSTDQEHAPGCDVERCSVCKSQFLSCGCDDHDPSKTTWAGRWPGEEECEKLGLWCLWTPGKGWVPCDKDTPGATHDLNRLAIHHANCRKN